MPRNALMSAYHQINGTGSHWYPQDIPRVYPTPQFIPDSMFNDQIFAAPSNPAARNSLMFDRMDAYEQNPQAYQPAPFPKMRGFR